MKIMKLKFTIPSVGDANTSISSSFLFRTSNKELFRGLYKVAVSTETNYKTKGNKIRKAKRDVDKSGYSTKVLNKHGEMPINIPRLSINDPLFKTQRGKVQDPITTTMADRVTKLLLTKSQNQNFLNTITFKYIDGESLVIYGRKGSQHHIDGLRISKRDLSVVLSKIIMRASFVRSTHIMDNYIDRVIHYPPNVLHAIENRSPYHFHVAGEKQEVLINTRVISDTECALEISEGIWGAISHRDLNVFLNTFRFGQSKSKTWYRVVPDKLWAMLMGSPPTEIQSKLCIAWLMQNRKHEMVENRATQLLHDMDNEYPEIELVQFKRPVNKALFVRGKACDWIVADEQKGMKLGRQNVNTYLIGAKAGKTIGAKSTWKGHHIHGPICIDNMHTNSSIGDQLTARALALMNDVSAKGHIYTIRDFVDKAEERTPEEQKLHRLDRNELNSWTQAKETAYITRMANKKKAETKA